MAIKFKDGILFTIDKSIFSPLVEEDDLEKFFRITPTIGSAASGLIADARVLIDILREKAQEEKKKYGEDPDLRTLVIWISRIYEVYTRYEGVRPFGTAIIIGGLDPTGFHLYETDPSGVFQEKKAAAIGKGSKTALRILGEKYKDTISKEQAIALAFLILKETLAERPQDVPTGEEFHIVTKDGFERIDLDDNIEKIQKLIKIAESSSKKKLPPASADLEEFLSGIKGVSSKVVLIMKERYRSLSDLKGIEEMELVSVPGIGKATARKILEALKDL